MSIISSRLQCVHAGVWGTGIKVDTQRGCVWYAGDTTLLRQKSTVPLDLFKNNIYICKSLLAQSDYSVGLSIMYAWSISGVSDLRTDPDGGWKIWVCFWIRLWEKLTDVFSLIGPNNRMVPWDNQLPEATNSILRIKTVVQLSRLKYLEMTRNVYLLGWEIVTLQFISVSVM